ncbi:ATP-binding cassette domain-containing protein, partial [Escherichia coli]|uniref:ATP-binding cassette domain-containing protein n=1 Tax=Escherichia coli TaxID=562 RepID=UPI00197D3DEC
MITVESLTRRYAGFTAVDDVSFTALPGRVTGFLGPNGAGKSTLFKLITGQEQPDTGTIDIGPTVQLGYVDQSRDALDPNKNVWEEISGGHDIMTVGKHEMSTRSYVGAFNFKGPDQQ